MKETICKLKSIIQYEIALICRLRPRMWTPLSQFKYSAEWFVFAGGASEQLVSSRHISDRVLGSENTDAIHSVE